MVRFQGSRNGRGRGGPRRRQQGRVFPKSGFSKDKDKPREMKFQTHGVGRQQQSTSYSTVKDYIIQYIQRTYDNGEDVCKALKSLTEVDFDEIKPTRKVLNKDARRGLSSEEIASRQESLDKEHELEYSSFVDRREDYRKNKTKAYALIFQQHCTKVMQHRIEEHPEFDSTIEDDPIELLKAIKVLMHDPIRAKYPFASLIEALTRWLNMKQHQDESLVDYIKRFKQNRDIVKSHLGTDFLDNFMSQTTEYKEQKTSKSKEELKNGAFGALNSYLILRNCDRDKYGSVIQGMESQYSMGHDQFPRQVTLATDILANHKFDSYKMNNKTKRHDHNRKESKPLTETSFMQAKMKPGEYCYCCGAKDHKSNACPKRNTIPRDQWVINRSGKKHSHFQKEIEDDESTGTIDARSASSKRMGWNHVQMCFNQNAKTKTDNLFKEMKESIVLDSGSSVDIFMNKDLVHNVRQVDDTMNIATNAGTQGTNWMGSVPNRDEVWLNENGVANIFSQAKTIDKGHRIYYDSDVEDAFIMELRDGNKRVTDTIKFSRNNSGLYTFKPTAGYIRQMSKLRRQEGQADDMVLAIASVAENKQGYTERELQRAKKARQLYHAIGTPTTRNFKFILRQNLIRNCPVTVEDVNIAEKIYGPDVGSLKGKTTRQKPKPVTRDIISIPKALVKNHSNIELCMDTMFVNNIRFLTSIDRTIRFRSAVYMRKGTHAAYYKAIDDILRVYNAAGFYITMIHCDREYVGMMRQVMDDLNIVINPSSTNEHVPDAERNIRTIKEGVRTAFSRLPFQKIPKLMIQKLVVSTTDKLNYFPTKKGISDVYSPRLILQLGNLDYDKHCQLVFGTYVQAHDEPRPSNSMDERTIDAIFLQPMKNLQGGHELMDLHTGACITRRRATVVPITTAIIQTVNKMGEDQGFKSLRFQDRANNILYDSNWIEGVDYTKEDDDTENDGNDDITYNEYTDDLSYNNKDELDKGYEQITYDEIQDILHDDDPAELDPTKPITDQIILDRTHANSSEVRNIDANPTEEDSTESGKASSDDDDEKIIVFETDSDSDSNGKTSDSVSGGDDSDESDAEPQVRRSGRTRQPVDRLNPQSMKGQSYFVHFEDNEELDAKHNLVLQQVTINDKEIGYEPYYAILIAKFITEQNEGTSIEGVSFGQQHILQKGLKVFGNKGQVAAMKELDQLHKRNCFTPISIDEMTPMERKRAMDALMFLTEKRDGSIKGRMVYNGKPSREWLTREDSASPTAALESIMLTATIDAHESRDIMSADVPNAFIQTEIPEDRHEKITMKINGVLVDMIVQLNPALYGPFVVYEKGKKVLYVQVLRAIYGMLESSLLWYMRFRDDLEKQGFKFNPYDPCVANRMVNGLQHTIRFHVDDLLSSHMDPKVNDEFLEWLNHEYGTYGEVKAVRGPIHDYLGMKLDFSKTPKVKIDMAYYVQDMLDDFPIQFKKNETAISPAGDNLFEEGKGKELDKTKAEQFHTTVAKGLFLCKRARPDIHTAIAVLCTRTRKPTESEWQKLIRLMKYLNGTKDLCLVLCAENLSVIKWFVDASFAVHPDYKSHTGATMMFGGYSEGAIQSISRKQKLNTKSSTESELVGADDASIMILWTKLFMEEQGYPIKKNILYQDNKSAILLETNGKRSSGKRSRYLNIRYFFLTDQAERGNVEIQYCPTDSMTGDYMTKPLQGAKFKQFRDEVMGMTPIPYELHNLELELIGIARRKAQKISKQRNIQRNKAMGSSPELTIKKRYRNAKYRCYSTRC